MTATFTPTGAGFGAGTTYTLELSDNTGAFGSPVSIGTLSGAGVTVGATNVINGSITTANIPSGTAANYRVRVTSTSPTVTGGQSGTQTVNLAPTNYSVSLTGTTTQSFATSGSGTSLTANPASFTPSGAATGVTYVWKYGPTGGPYTNTIGGATSASYTPTGADLGGSAGVFGLISETTSSCGSVVRQSSEATITLTAPAPAMTIRQGSTGGTIYPSGGTAYSGFANTAMGATSSAVTFFIMNTGTATLNLGTLTPSGDFAISSPPGSSSIAAGGNTSFQVTFTPTATGTRTGSISLASNDPATPYGLNLSAVGLPSNVSDVVANGSFTYNTTGIDYASKQGTSITNTNNTLSEAIYSVTVRDGGAGLNDADALPTILNSLTFSSVQGVGSIRSAALFNVNTKVSADANMTINTGAGTIAFTSLGFSVADNTSENLTLRVTFNTTATDAQQLRVSLTNANVATTGTSSTFSSFATLNSTTTAGSNEVNVISDRLRYNPAPPATAGINVDQSVGVEAVDVNNNRDTDFRSASTPSVTLSRGAGTGAFSAASTLTKTLTSGLANWTDLRYNTVETGVGLIATATSLPGSSPTLTTSATINFVAFAGILWDGGAATSNWNDANNWSGNVVPTGADDVRLDNTIISGSYTVNVNVNGAAARSLQVGYSSNPNTITLNINPDNGASDMLTVGDGINAVAPDLIIAQGGRINNNDAGAGLTNDGLRFNNGANDGWQMTDNAYFFQANRVSYPNVATGKANFAATSTFEMEGFSGSGTLIQSFVARIKTYGNLKITNPATTSNIVTTSSTFASGDSLVVLGDLTVTSTGGQVNLNGSSAKGVRLRVAGNMNIDNAIFAVVNDASNNSTFNRATVLGNITTTNGGSFRSTAVGLNVGRLFLSGSFSGIYNAGANTTTGFDELVFIGGSGVSNFNYTSGTIRNIRTYKEVKLGATISVSTLTLVKSTGTLDFNNFNVGGNSTFTLEAGGTLKITSPFGISAGNATGATVGNVQTTLGSGRNFPNGAVYWYTGTAAQVTGTGLPTTNGTKTVICDNPTTLTLTNPTIASGTGIEVRIQASASFAPSQPTVQLGTLEIRQGTLIETATAEVVGTGALKMTGGRYWMVKGVASGTPTALPQLSGTYSLTGGSIALGGANNQSLKGGLTYNKLTFATSGIKTLTSSISNVPDSVAVTGAAFLDLTQSSAGVVGTIGLSGTGALRMTGTSWLKSSLTSAVSPAPGMQGVYDLTGGTIEFANSSGTIQTIRGNDVADPTRTYNNVWVNGTNVGCSLGNFAIRSGGTFTVKTGADFSIVDQAITGAGDFVMETGTTLQYGSPNGITTVAGGGTGTSSGNIRVAGTRTYISTATYIVRGAGNSVTGDGLPSSVTNLTLNKSTAGNEVTLTSPLTVTGALTFTEGLLSLQNASVTIAPAGSIVGASSTKYVRTSTSPSATGSLIQRVPASATDVVYPVGTSSYTPARLQLTALSTADDFGVRVFDGVFMNGTSGTAVSTHVVDRTWDITEGTPGGSNAAVTLQWNSTDANITFNRFLCGVSHYLGAGIWDHQLAGFAAATDLGGGVYERSRSGLTSFSPFAMQDGSMPLPVELIAFDAQPAGDNVRLTWATASESDNDRFEVLRSADGRKFSAIGTVRGAGNSTVRRDYELVDAAPLAGTAYYRLRMVDTKGQAQLSGVHTVTRKATTPVLALYPNPATARITVASNVLSGSTLRIVDALGRVVLERLITTTEATTELSIQSLPAGTYRLLLIPAEGPMSVLPLVKMAE